MKKILIINPYYFPTIFGGAEISSQLLAEDLKQKYEVKVLCTKEKDIVKLKILTV